MILYDHGFTAILASHGCVIRSRRAKSKSNYEATCGGLQHAAPPMDSETQV